MSALAMLELMSIPKGMLACDAMLKAADVTLVCAQAVCAGKYIIIVSGDVAAVSESLQAGKTCSGVTLVDSVLISSVHPQVISAINSCSEVGEVGALGVCETYSLAGAVLMADTMIKTSSINLVEIRLGRGLGGKSFIVLTGEVAAVNSAVEAGQNLEEVRGLVAGSEVIPMPHPSLVQAIM